MPVYEEITSWAWIIAIARFRGHKIQGTDKLSRFSAAGKGSSHAVIRSRGRLLLQDSGDKIQGTDKLQD